MKKIGFGLLTAMLLLWIIGCGNSSEPTTPGTDFNESTVGETPVFVSDLNSDGTPLSGMGALGVFQVRVDTNTLEYDMVPLRNTSASTKDVLEVIDITNFMTLWPCRDCAKLLEVGFTGQDELDLKFGIKHPFAAPKMSDPISALNRADLHMFNVEGMLVFKEVATLFPEIGIKAATPKRVNNADGYSGYLDDVLESILSTPADVHPYITYFVDYSNGNYNPSNAFGFSNLAAPSGYMVMKQGSNMDAKDFFVNYTPGEVLDFLFVVQASWGASVQNYTQRLTAVYDCPQFNKKAPSKVNVIVTGELIAGNPASTVDVKVEVLDINHDAEVGTDIGKMLDDSSVKAVKIEVPNITGGEVVFNNPTPAGGNARNPADPMYFAFEIANLESELEGTYPGIVEVIDNYATGQNPNPLLATGDGAGRVPPIINPITNLFQIDHFSTYQVFEVVVGEANLPPVAVFHTIPSSDCYIPRDVDVVIDASDSFDPNTGSGPCAQVVQYEFDFEWNGVQADFAPDVVSDEAYQIYQFTQSGPNVIGVRVTDGCNPPLSSPIEALNVIIGNPDFFRPEQRQISIPMEETMNPLQPMLNTTPLAVKGNNVYAAWTAHTDDLDYVYAARSADGGCTWGDFERIYQWHECALETYVFVALDVLANGDPILIVISPGTVICNYQAWFFHGRNIGVNGVDWGREYAADLYGVKSAFVDMVAHPNDPTVAYMVQWRYDDEAPNNLMFVKIKQIGSSELVFPHWEVDIGTNIYDIDMVAHMNVLNPKLHVVYNTNTQVKYMTLIPSEEFTPLQEGPITVNSPSEIDSGRARIELNALNEPVVVYHARYPGSDYNIVLKHGTGSPVTFPSIPDYVTTSTLDQMRPDIRLNTVTGEWWMVYDQDNQIMHEVLDGGFNMLRDGIVNTDDPTNNHRDFDPSIIFNPAEYSANVLWVEDTDSPFELSCSFNRTN